MLKVEETILTDDEYGFEADCSVIVEVFNNGIKVHSVEFSEGEPEDMSLGRNLNDAYGIVPLIGTVADCLANTDEPISYITRRVRKKDYYGF